jgi:polyphenol oxidase
MQQSEILLQLPGIIHGFSGRINGDMRKDNIRQDFCKSHGWDFTSLITAKQVHGDNIVVVDQARMLHEISDTDGLIYIEKNQEHQTPILGVKTADCVPVLFVDPVHRIIAVAHSGWRGTLLNITAKVVRLMCENGAKISDIYTVIGPYIGACCYDVGDDRASMFSSQFNSNKVVVNLNGKYHIDIGYAVDMQLLEMNLLPEHIQLMEICTSCRNQEYFSHRKDLPDQSGMNISFIGFK